MENKRGTGALQSGATQLSAAIYSVSAYVHYDPLPKTEKHRALVNGVHESLDLVQGHQNTHAQATCKYTHAQIGITLVRH